MQACVPHCTDHSDPAHRNARHATKLYVEMRPIRNGKRGIDFSGRNLIGEALREGF